MRTIARVLSLKDLGILQEELDWRRRDLEGHSGFDTPDACPICSELRWECKVISIRIAQLKDGSIYISPRRRKHE